MTIYKRLEMSEMKDTIKGWFKFEHHDAEGRLVWMDEGPNNLVDAGVNYVWNNDMDSASIYIGLWGAAGISGVFSSSWTMTEAGGDGTLYVTPTNSTGKREIYHQYTGERKRWVTPPAVSKTLHNVESPAVFTFPADSMTVYGAFLTTHEIKNTNNVGTLIAARVLAAPELITAPGTFSAKYILTGANY
jgi:hypothetical protein